MTSVVKLGGSLAEAGTIRSWLETLTGAGLTGAGIGRCIVVPGGGVFADAVRTAQPLFGFGDRAAHEMALLAMAQYGLLLADLAPLLLPVEDEAGIASALAEGRIPVWLPRRMVMAAPEIAAAWEVTSDSLAAWLARKLNARRLVLVKSVPAPEPLPGLEELARIGLVDAAFPAFAAQASFTLEFLGPGQKARLASLIGLGPDRFNVVSEP